MTKFNVSVVRIGYASMEIQVEAEDAKEAKYKALDLAPDRLFREHASEYKTEWVARQLPTGKIGVEWP